VLGGHPQSTVGEHLGVVAQPYERVRPGKRAVDVVEGDDQRAPGGVQHDAEDDDGGR
jgi:hypothetical protein